MQVLAVYARLYAVCAARAAKAIVRSPWTLILPAVAVFAAVIASMLVAPLGVAAGIVMAFVQAALLSGYFYFVAEGVSGARVAPSELSKSLRKYFWSFVNLSFVIWIAELVLTTVLKGPNAGLLFRCFQLGAFVLLNATPEMITQRGTYGGLATVQASVEFIQESWLEWFIPNLLVGALLFFGLPLLNGAALLVAAGARGVVLPIVGEALLLSAVLHFFALYRSFLFLELTGSTHRQRMFKYRRP